MKRVMLNLDNSSDKNLYIQIYEQFKEKILSGELPQGSKMPSLRRFAKENEISV